MEHLKLFFFVQGNVAVGQVNNVLCYFQRLCYAVKYELFETLFC